MDNNNDLDYITAENYKLILERINYVLDNPNTANNKPTDFIQLLEIKNYIFRKFC